ncbi:cytidylyltransferase domain-containing protein [Thermodesulfobacteriota bacterium]
MIAALLLGRKGSVGFPGKNTMSVLERPLCAYPMMAAINSKYVDKLYISTDDGDIMDIGRKYGADIIVRPPELCTREALGEAAYVHGYEAIRDKAKTPDSRRDAEEIELMVLLFCNAATIMADTIDEGITVLRDNPDYDSAVTVSCYNMWSPLRARKIGEDGLLHPFVPFETFGDPNTLNCDRDSQGDVWFADMGVSIVRPRCLENLDDGLLPQKWMGRRIYPLKQWGGCDIDYVWQVAGVEYWLKEHGFTEGTTPYDNR